MFFDIEYFTFSSPSRLYFIVKFHRIGVKRKEKKKNHLLDTHNIIKEEKIIYILYIYVCNRQLYRYWIY